MRSAALVRVSNMRARARLIGSALLLAGLLIACVALLTAPPAHAGALAGHATQNNIVPHVDELAFDRAVDPSAARYLQDAITTAEGDGALALVVTLDTPGGDLASMETMEKAELASTVPILIWVGPAGAVAGSAGTIVALAAPVVAMAPDTTIGAASPVNIDGSDIGATEKAKVEHYLTTLVDQLQNTYGRNTTDAEATITQAQAFTEQQAVADHLVNLEATSVSDLLGQEDGQTITLGTGTGTTLHLANAVVTDLQPTFINQVETILFDPNVDFILFIFAVICIYLELAHPGAIVPGVIGVLALILFLLGAQSLNPDWAGLALMLAGLVLLAVDVRVPTHGVLTFGGVICLALGSFIFFDTGVSRPTMGAGPTLSIGLIVGLCVGVGIVSVIVLRYATRISRGPYKAGASGLVGQDALVVAPLAPEGRVRVLGEDWAARLDVLTQRMGVVVEPGQIVRVLRVDGLVLIVEPVVPANALQKGAS